MIYKIPTVQTYWGLIEVEAEYMEDAINKALLTTPKELEYVDDSQQIDWEGISIHNDLDPDDTVYVNKYIDA
jgi:hypothetical protein